MLEKAKLSNNINALAHIGFFSWQLLIDRCHQPQSSRRPLGLHHNDVWKTIRGSCLVLGAGAGRRPKDTEMIQHVILSDCVQAATNHCINQHIPSVNINANQTIWEGCVDYDLAVDCLCKNMLRKGHGLIKRRRFLDRKHEHKGMSWLSTVRAATIYQGLF